MAAPTLASVQRSTFANEATATTPAITWAAGDTVLVLGMSADNIFLIATPTAAGLTFSGLTGSPTNTANRCKAYAWSAVAAGSGTQAVTATMSGGASRTGGIIAIVITASTTSGLGTPVFSTALGSTTTQNLTRGSADSAVACLWGDFNAVNDTTVTWTPGGQTQRVATHVSGQATFFSATWPNEGASGTTAYGFSGFAGGQMTAVTIEITGVGGGGGGTWGPLLGMQNNRLVQALS